MVLWSWLVGTSDPYSVPSKCHSLRQQRDPTVAVVRQRLSVVESRGCWRQSTHFNPKADS